jgi:hypothetical protein
VEHLVQNFRLFLDNARRVSFHRETVPEIPAIRLALAQLNVTPGDSAFTDKLALEFGDGRQDAQQKPASRIPGIGVESLADGEKADFVLLQFRKMLAEMQHRAAKAVKLPN